MSTPALPVSIPSYRQEGFTLMELLVAMTLLGILVAALFGGLRLGTRVWEASDRSLDQSSEADVIRGFLRARLEQVLPVTDSTYGDRAETLFRGDRKSLRFVSSMPISFGHQPYLLELRLQPRRSASPVNDLLLSWRTLDEALGVGSVPRVGNARRLDDVDGGERVLIEDVAAIAFRYFDSRGEQAGAWSHDWSNQKALPGLIRLELSFPKGDLRRWSPLVVSPMIDEWYDTFFW